jgi:hypothetical protein
MNLFMGLAKNSVIKVVNCKSKKKDVDRFTLTSKKGETSFLIKTEELGKKTFLSRLSRCYNNNDVSFQSVLNSPTMV